MCSLKCLPFVITDEFNLGFFEIAYKTFLIVEQEGLELPHQQKILLSLSERLQCFVPIALRIVGIVND